MNLIVSHIFSLVVAAADAAAAAAVVVVDRDDGYLLSLSFVFPKNTSDLFNFNRQTLCFLVELVEFTTLTLKHDNIHHPRIGGSFWNFWL
jgi:hypothetical protein